MGVELNSIVYDISPMDSMDIYDKVSDIIGEKRDYGSLYSKVFSNSSPLFDIKIDSNNKTVEISYIVSEYSRRLLVFGVYIDFDNFNILSTTLDMGKSIVLGNFKDFIFQFINPVSDEILRKALISYKLVENINEFSNILTGEYIKNKMSSISLFNLILSKYTYNEKKSYDLEFEVFAKKVYQLSKLDSIYKRLIFNTTANMGKKYIVNSKSDLELFYLGCGTDPFGVLNDINYSTIDYGFFVEDDLKLLNANNSYGSLYIDRSNNQKAKITDAINTSKHVRLANSYLEVVDVLGLDREDLLDGTYKSNPEYSVFTDNEEHEAIVRIAGNALKSGSDYTYKYRNTINVQGTVETGLKHNPLTVAGNYSQVIVDLKFLSRMSDNVLVRR
nr:MAG TPA: hypothetical protein [Caudoviricetes sp.]